MSAAAGNGGMTTPKGHEPSFMKQTFALVKKNFILKRRHWISRYAVCVVCLYAFLATT